VLDITATTEDLGKPAGSDEAAGKSTYPKLMGAQAATERAEELLDEALWFLRRAGLGDGLLEELAGLCVRRGF
jgi:geranylgeranyl pyrophosphate synthase